MNDDTPPNGHPRTSVPGGEIGDRLREVEARLVALDTRDAEQHVEIAARLTAMARGLEDVGGQVVTRLDALAAAYQQTLSLRAFACVEAVAGKMFTPASSPIYALAVLVFAVALTATTIRWGDIAVGRGTDAAVNAHASDDAGVSAGAEPSPEP